MFFNGISPKEVSCCGCGGCTQICPHNAISMTTTSDGFSLPAVNSDLCVECGLCEKVCPMVDPEKVLSPVIGTCYAAINTNHPVLMKSSSGGVFSIIAEYILEEGGIVYGAAFNQDMNLSHVCVTKKENLGIVRGSKYLQSNIDRTFKEIRHYLRDGRTVYFTGTGCQISALKKFLIIDYPNLFTSDILCHGVPNQKVFSSVVQTLEQKYSGKIVNYNFRDKRINGWSCTSSCEIQYRDLTKYIGYDKIMSAYFYSFISGYMNRESCYLCPYASSRRCGDITLGDFWGVKKYIKVPNRRDGVSAILVNTGKGKEIISKLTKEKRVKLIPANINDVAVVNETLRHPTQRPPERSVFFQNFKSNSNYMLQLYSGKGLKQYLMYRIKKVIKSSNLLDKLYNRINN